ncbi:MAG: hypothetical protein ABR968_08610, partial [Bacteroidales bacterium]
MSSYKGEKLLKKLYDEKHNLPFIAGRNDKAILLADRLHHFVYKKENVYFMRLDEQAAKTKAVSEYAKRLSCHEKKLLMCCENT